MSIINMSITAGVLIAVIVIIRKAVLNKLPKTMFLALWAVVLCRLLIPFDVPSKFSIYTWGRKIRPAVSIAVHEVGRAINGANTGAPSEVMEVAQKANTSISPIKVIWIIGMISFFIFFAVVYYKNYKKLKSAKPIKDNIYIEKWVAENKLVRNITFLQSDSFKSPVTFGIIKPRIILPNTMDMENYELMQYVFTHEYCHIKRFDMFWKLLMALALCIHWFNPMVWIMLILVYRDLEITCDEMVVRCFGSEKRTNYAYSLIGMLEDVNGISPYYNGFSKNHTEERIEAVMKYKKSSLITILLAITMVFGMTSVFAFGPSKVPEKIQYSEYGISYDKDGQMLYNGKIIRYYLDAFDIDEETSVVMTKWVNENGVVDVRTIRETIDNGDGSTFGQVIGLEEYEEPVETVFQNEF